MNPIYYHKQFHPNKLYLIHEGNGSLRTLTVCKFISAYSDSPTELYIIPIYERMRMLNYHNNNLMVMDIKDSRANWRQGVQFRPHECEYFELTDEEAHAILIEEI